MTLTQPLALFGLAAAAAPIIIYFLLRRRKTEVDWGASYLLRLTLRSRRKSSLWKQLLVLAVRVFILAAAAMLIARPYEPNPEPDLARPALPEGAVHRVVLVDHSLSMTAVERGESRRTRQARALLGLLSGLRPGDRATLVSLLGPPRGSHRAKVVSLPGPLKARKTSEVLNEFPPTPGAIHLSEGLVAAARALAESPGTSAEIYALSDFPRELAGQEKELRWFGGQAGKKGWRLAMVNLADAPRAESYLAIHSVELGSELALANVPVHLYVDASCYGDEELAAVFEGHVNGQLREKRDIRFKPNERMRFGWPVTFSEPGEAVVTIRTAQARLPAHAEQSLVLRVHDRAVIWAVEEPAMAAKGDGPGPMEFVLRALRREHDGHELFHVEEKPATELTRPIPREVDVVFLAAPRFAPGGAAEYLTDFVRRGGGLVIGATPGMKLDGYNKRFGRLLPASLSGLLRPQSDPGTFFSIRPELVAGGAFLFREFTSRAGGDLAEVRVYNALQCGEVTGEALFHLGNGQPLLLRRRVGRGWVYLWTSSFGIEWNSMPVRQAFVPFLVRLVHAAMSGRVYPANLEPGETVVVPWAGASPVSIFGPGTFSSTIQPTEWQGGTYLVFRAPEAPGLYRLRERGPGGRESHFTVKGSLPEGDLRPLDDAGRQLLSTALGTPIYDGWPAAVRSLGPAGAQREGWPYLLVFMLALYLFETWFVRRV